MSSELVRALQERAARAQPAAYVEEVGGWWLRHFPQGSWWLGSVLPHGAVTADRLPERVVAAEDFYARRRAVARFQITPGACPAGLDALLAERGYRRHSAMSLQVAPTARVVAQPPASTVRVRVDDRPTKAWWDAWHAVRREGSDAGPERGMLARVPGDSAYVRAAIGDEVVASGRAVADTGWVGVFGLATIPAARGQGAARGMLAALAGWADARRAAGMYLQVERDNAAALRLYARTGFHELAGYHYRSDDRVDAARPPA
ncbi:GNAT family N-acetyltransferase [Micromonospora sp. WMMD812]|uniref:GNAT family N-acetyltransferase n=1 Tax=Micromonospora sp. WMMD812 TaxID=3015152 RepID=UPI00248BF95B|nr:GNAT family N-acetyltransferase [Micromonospora sp. WMMD812]WBB68030.1 GNAT family N-acetyltransferase [Micromonospora sp. WMMD812]